MQKSNYTPGTTLWVERQNQWLAMGIDVENMIKPKIAVVNTSGGAVNGCYGHLDELSRIVQHAILDRGALPFEIKTKPLENAVVSARMKRAHPMLSRDLLAREIQTTIEGAFLDGMVCISSDERDTPAHLIAAARSNVPTVILACGYQAGAACENDRFDDQFFDIFNVYDEIGPLASGGVTREEYAYLPQASVITTGACSGLSMANSMQLTAEALGMTLPGNSPIWAKGKRLRDFARRAGETVVQLTLDNVLPRNILTAKAFENAVMVMLAAGGSIGTVRHLSAIAAATGLPVDVLSLFERFSRDINLLTAIRPNGIFRTEDFDGAGGTAALMTRLSGYLNLDSMTVAQTTLGENIAGSRVNNDEIILPLKEPLSNRPSIGILRGNLAPEGALIRLAALPAGCERISGPAKVFTSEHSAVEAVQKGSVHKGNVLILRNMDPEGRDGEMFAFSLAAALHGCGLAEFVAVVTDGQLSALNRSIVAGLVMPDAASGGPLAAVRDGDWIYLDFTNLRIQLDIPNDEMDIRLREQQACRKPNAPVRTLELEMKPCWCQDMLDENYQESGHSIHGRMCERKGQLTF